MRNHSCNLSTTQTLLTYMKQNIMRQAPILLPVYGVKIYDYLCDVLGRIDNHIGSLVDLLPHKWEPMSLALSY